MTHAQPTDPTLTSTDNTSPGEDAGVSTGMATGSDAGAPGDHPAPEPLDDAEQELLDDLRHDDSPDVVRAVEDGAAAAGAADDDSVLPVGDGAAGPDEDTPRFVEPV